MDRSTSKLRARVAPPVSRASIAPRRRRSVAAAVVVWRWSAWYLPLLLGFLCAGNSTAALRAVDASSSSAAAATGATSLISDSDAFTYESSWDSSPFNLQSVTENNLGLMAKACSQTYCHAGTSGLDLWVSLEEVSYTFHQVPDTCYLYYTHTSDSGWTHFALVSFLYQKCSRVGCHRCKKELARRSCPGTPPSVRCNFQNLWYLVRVKLCAYACFSPTLPSSVEVGSSSHHVPGAVVTKGVCAMLLLSLQSAGRLVLGGG